MRSLPPRAAVGRIPLAGPTLLVGLGAATGAQVPALVLPAVLPLALLAALRAPARLACASLLLGLLLGREADRRARPPPTLAGLETPAVYRLEGTVEHVELPAWRAQRIVLTVEAVGEPPLALARAHPLPVTVRLTGRSTWRWHDVVPGSRVHLLALVRRRRDGLRGVVTDRRGLTLLERGEGLAAALARRRRRASWSFARHLDRRDAGLARALLLGDRGRLDRADRALFRHTGQAHLLAVSGLHVGLLIGGFLLVLRLLGVGLRATWIAGIVLAALYVPFTGAPPSAVRAGIGAIAWFLGALAARAPRGLAVLVLVALLVLLAGPGNLRSVSFQLSFAAVASILLLAERLRAVLVPERLVIHRLLPPRRTPLRAALSVSLAAWLGTAPLVALHIGRLCPTGPLLAVPAVPVTAGLLGSGFVLVVAEDVPALGPAAAWSFEQLAALLRGMLALARDAQLGALDVHAPAPLWGGLYLGAFAVAARAGRRGMLAALAGMALLLGLLLLPMPVPGLSRAPVDEPPAYDAPAVFLADLPAQPAPVESADLFFPLAVLALAAFAGLAVRLGWLKPGGAAAAWVLGVAAAWPFRWMGLAALFAPFLVATLLGKLPGATRAEARSLRQVLCNGLPAFVGVVLVIAGAGVAGTLAFLGALACLGADTCATEIGVRFGGRPFRLTGGRAEPGESGGVTAAGLLASVGGAALAPGAAWLATGGRLPIAWVVASATAGFLAALLDSVLGGTLQFRGRVTATGETTEAVRLDGATVERVHGWRWLDNDAVNLISGFAGAVLAVLLASLA